jgi:hypothetical protein
VIVQAPYVGVGKKLLESDATRPYEWEVVTVTNRAGFFFDTGSSQKTASLPVTRSLIALVWTVRNSTQDFFSSLMKDNEELSTFGSGMCTLQARLLFHLFAGSLPNFS